MCELRGFSILRQPVDLETIEEEPDDYQSQHSRGGARSLRNGIEGGDNGRFGAGIAGAGLYSQTNTITTYATQYSDGFDLNSYARQMNNANAAAAVQHGHPQGLIGLVRIKRKKFDDQFDSANALFDDDGRHPRHGTMETGGTTTTGSTTNKNVAGTSGETLKSDKWDHNYYFNDYGPSQQDPLQLYQWSNKQNYAAAMRKQIKERRKRELQERRSRICCSIM